MKSYEEIKQALIKHKDKFVLGACFVLVFIVGFGAGSYEKSWRRDKVQSSSNYTSNTAKTPVKATTTQSILVQVNAKSPTASSTDSNLSAAGCVVKGNISTAGKKIYHVAGGAFYKIVKPEQCFKTEAEAVAAGFIKSGR